MIDRPLRPLFPEGYGCETQVVGLLLSADLENDSDTLAIIGRLDRPLHLRHPLRHARGRGARRVLGRAVRGEPVVGRPAHQEPAEPPGGRHRGRDRDGRVGRPGALRGGDGPGPRSTATRSSSRSSASRSSSGRSVGKPKRTVAKKQLEPGARRARSRPRWPGPLLEAMRKTDKLEMYARMKQVRDEYVASVPEDRDREEAPPVPAVYDGLREKILRSEILENGRRLDGRAFDQIRPITSEVGVLPRTHGSALFTRGETQALVTVTLGTSEDSQIIDTVQEPESPQALHAPLQLPALLGGRGEVPARPRPARDRPRRPGRARAPRDAARTRKTSPTRSASSRTSSSRTARRRWPRSAAAPWPSWTRACPSRARWPASPWASSRRATAGRSSPTSPARKTTTATWTSRSRAPARASPPSRWTSRSAGITAEILAKALEQARQGRLHILDRMAEALAAPRTSISAVRAAHHHDPDARSTRSATSSGPAAR